MDIDKSPQNKSFNLKENCTKKFRHRELDVTKCGLFGQVLQVTKHPLPKEPNHLSIFIKHITHITFTLRSSMSAPPRAIGNEVASVHKLRSRDQLLHLPIFLTRLRKLLNILYYIIGLTIRVTRVQNAITKNQ